ncbi:Uu.00g008980.m01.CDS01 [Anthostomella pinea]|uniref:Uu.00g008980.m01.CDS01 n=1 Tax=Anthostomella pinea TaxID=933095 RepID=A0AAI8VXZ0_9PEZI|nr:Uu.00g008980.m01.CDS01 [Anthostomella pinea]
MSSYSASLKVEESQSEVARTGDRITEATVELNKPLEAAKKLVLPLIHQKPTYHNSEVRDRIHAWAATKQTDGSLKELTEDELLKLGRQVWEEATLRLKYPNAKKTRKYISLSFDTKQDSALAEKR